MNVLITGGAGFGGSGLARALLEKGHQVTIFDSTAPGEADKLRDLVDQGRVTYIWKAIHDIYPTDVANHDVVIHLQAQADVPMGFGSPIWTAHQNVMGTVALLEAVAALIPVKFGPDKVIYAGSGNEWGRGEYFPIDEKHPLTPHNPYAFSKAAAELACWAWWRCYNVPIVIMSNGIVTGPDMRKEIFLYKWLKAIARCSPNSVQTITLEGGDQTRDVTHVDDVIAVWLTAIEAPVEDVVGQKFQVSYGEEHSVRDILEMCFEVTGKQIPIDYAPYRPGEEGQRECFDNSKARRVLGYNPQIGPREAIRLTWEWVKETL